MAQQTINVGAAPNDGTGTPLRTAFQYTNSNFTELYTAVGPSGNNIVVPGTATITGDLTVDTNTLKVVSSLDFVGIGATTQSFGEKFRINGNYTVMNDGTFTGFLGKASAIGASGATADFGIRSENDLLFLTNGANLRMTLNSTGLGLGGVPSGVNRFAVWNGATQAMTLDTSGNLLVGTTSGTYHTFRKNVAADAGNQVFEIQGTGGGTSSIYYSVSGYNANAANSAAKFGRDATTLRSINAGGTVNASGADYAEYMVKCGDFVLAKGDVAGIDANGKLTNVFADAVSFVVKSTDPSYVGNDKWGVDLEGADLEAARQLVDRIAFAGQVPVNVTGAKAGDYIVPVVNGTGIKGQAVSNPTFEQYQLAVGKVISIDADGRARIIVKVA